MMNTMYKTGFKKVFLLILSLFLFGAWISPNSAFAQDEFFVSQDTGGITAEANGGIGDLFPDLIDLGDDWFWSPWLGYIYGGFFPWIYHIDHGWLYPAIGESEGEFWFWDTNLRWFWTRSDIYPMLWSEPQIAWLFYLEETVNPRSFYNLDAEKFITTVPLPSKAVAFDLIGIHNPGSASYDADCISCHGDRTGEIALDGVTPTAHSRMLGLFGTGNARCIKCHEDGPSFINYSSGGLREPVSFASQVGNCLACHNVNSGSNAFYAK